MLQMFLCLTRLVLRAKRAQQARLQQASSAQSDTVRLSSTGPGARNATRRKKKCC